MRMAGLEAVWEIFVRFLWPLVLAYVGYVHWQMARMMQKFDDLQKAHFEHKAEVNKDFVSKDAVGVLEARITATLNRIDDKITMLLQREPK